MFNTEILCFNTIAGNVNFYNDINYYSVKIVGKYLCGYDLNKCIEKEKYTKNRL